MSFFCLLKGNIGIQLERDNHRSNPGGIFKLYDSNGSKNVNGVSLSEGFFACATGSQRYYSAIYRGGQAATVDSGSAMLADTRLPEIGPPLQAP